MQRTLSVTAINEYIRGVLEDELVLSNISVEGEVSNFRSSGKTLFFSLKDSQSLISCLCFDPDPNTAIGDGVSILCTATPAFYPKTGKISLIVSSYRIVGKGEQAAKLNELQKSLEKEGLFLVKKSFPKTIGSIGIVTSSKGAVVHDIINVATRRDPSVNIYIVDALVQGDNAHTDIQKALKVAESYGVDAVIVARGGGASEDLSAFNTEAVARAVAACKCFTVSAVGHETDTTICDLAADLRAPTPSAAAELLTAGRSGKLSAIKLLSYRLLAGYSRIYGRSVSQLKDRISRMTYGSEGFIYKARSKVSGNAGKLAYLAEQQAASKRYALAGCSSRLSDSCSNKLRTSQTALDMSIERLRLTEPARILKSGYAKVFFKGKALTLSRQVEIGQELEVSMHDGTIITTVKRIEE